MTFFSTENHLNGSKGRHIIYKDIDVGDGSWWNIPQNLWESLGVIKKKKNKLDITRYISRVQISTLENGLAFHNIVEL